MDSPTPTAPLFAPFPRQYTPSSPEFPPIGRANPVAAHSSLPNEAMIGPINHPSRLRKPNPPTNKTANVATAPKGIVTPSTTAPPMQTRFEDPEIVVDGTSKDRPVENYLAYNDPVYLWGLILLAMVFFMFRSVLSGFTERFFQAFALVFNFRVLVFEYSFLFFNSLTPRERIYLPLAMLILGLIYHCYCRMSKQETHFHRLSKRVAECWGHLAVQDGAIERMNELLNEDYGHIIRLRDDTQGDLSDHRHHIVELYRRVENHAHGHHVMVGQFHRAKKAVLVKMKSLRAEVDGIPEQIKGQVEELDKERFNDQLKD